MASPSSRTETASSSSRSYSSPFASYTSVNFAPRLSHSTTRSSSSLYGHRTSSSPPSVRFSVEQRPSSPGKSSMTVTKKQMNNNAAVSSSSSSSSSSSQKRTCMCSPTTHPGSFRCGYHKRLAEEQQQKQQQSSRRLNLRRSAMKNSLVRIGGVEGEIVKRTLTTLIRPSSHQLRRREAFQPRPTRLSVMSKAQDS